jgi:hypothetical protein
MLNPAVKPLIELCEKLKPGEEVRLKFQNPLYHGLFLDLMTGDMDPVYFGLTMTIAEATRILMDLGMYTTMDSTILGTPPPPKLLEKLRPYFEEYGHPYQVAEQQLAINKFFVKAVKLPPVDKTDYPGMAFAVCRSGYPRKFRRNLGRPVEWNPYLNPKNERYENMPPSTSPMDAIDKAKGTKKPLIVYLHQDVFLPQDWEYRVWNQWQKAQHTSGGKIGLAGVFGLTGNRLNGSRTEFGRIVDFMGMRSLERNSFALPIAADTIDELCCIMPSDSMLDMDRELGWHFTGADMAIKLRREGRQVAVLDAPLLHASALFDLPPDYAVSEKIFAKKNADSLPFEVPCGVVQKQNP